LHVLRHRNQG